VKDRVEAFIRGSGDPGDEAAFDRIAVEVFRYQVDSVPLYRAFCASRALRPTDVRSWRDVPAIPADAFKHGLTTAEERPHVFVSSGTTEGVEYRSRHALSTLETYRLSAMTHFARMVMPDVAPMADTTSGNVPTGTATGAGRVGRTDDPPPSPPRGRMSTLVLGPTAETHPQSSLGQMFSWCIDDYAAGEAAVCFDSEGRADLERACAWLAGAAGGSTPVLIVGVSSAFTALFGELRRRDLQVRLPADSRMVDTGGGKGGARVLSARGMLKACWRFLHVPAYLAINEYGMTEMLSQLYDDALASRYEGCLQPRAKVGPHWLRTMVVDPATLEPLPDGEVGILRHFDLANWESVAAIQTLDLGRKLGRGIELLGRARGAEARGCSALLRTVRDAAASA
jgi:hypothetical protein